MRKPSRRPRRAAAASFIPCTTGSRRRFAAGFRRSSMKARSAPCGQFAGRPCARSRQSPSRPMGRTGAPIRLSPAVEYCSIMDGTRFIASCAGSAFPALSARCSRSAAFANGRSKILRPSRWTGKTAALRSI